MNPRTAALIPLISSLLFLQSPVKIQAGQEFRGFGAIPSPAAEHRTAEDLAAEGYQRISTAQNISTPMVEKMVYDLFESWNSHTLDKKLSRDFPNKNRLMEAIQTGVPRHVELQVLSVQNPRIVEQYVRPHPSGDGTYQLLSKVSVRVYSQIAASSSIRRQFQRADGVSDYLFSVTQKVKAA